MGHGRPSVRNVVFGIYVASCLLAQIWPVYDWFGNSIEPFVLGVPFSLAWVVGWIIATFIALLAYHVTGDAHGARNAARGVTRTGS